MKPAHVEVRCVDSLRMVETGVPAVPPDELRALNKFWDKAVQANPYLFDGPSVVCAKVVWPTRRTVEISWARATYRRNALRFVPEATTWLPSLFVCTAQPTDCGGLVVGRMASHTASPGQWQLPGGSVEPPPQNDVLNTSALQRHAAQEMAEETGTAVTPDELHLKLFTRRANGSIGILFLAPALSRDVLLEQFAAHTSAQQEPEFDRIAIVHTPDDLEQLDGPRVDYLDQIVRDPLQ
ncbi:NUDIX hydrolase [Streptomyces sp. VB1]|uniref:NUDIX hydrolase n=1 Tax=Streptomyces sp. VB1 TaxID=2986803 RepID=UPI002241D4E5|nr:NUDIX hydrolase [Streptomyces sp. VB1]UZI32382.1 NUDIX hydrolase [Streptomyces sp. VB1]